VGLAQDFRPKDGSGDDAAAHLKEKLVKLESQMQRLTSGRGSGVVGYNVQIAVDIEHHLIVTHEVTNSGSDRAQLANIACVAARSFSTLRQLISCTRRPPWAPCPSFI
jgi:hypothetical protein